MISYQDPAIPILLIRLTRVAKFMPMKVTARLLAITEMDGKQHGGLSKTGPTTGKLGEYVHSVGVQKVENLSNMES